MTTETSSAAPQAATEAPAVPTQAPESAPLQPARQEPKTQGTRNRMQEARSSAVERAGRISEAQTAAPVTPQDSQNREAPPEQENPSDKPRNPDGTFAAKAQDAPADPNATSPAPSAAAPASEVIPEGMVKIDLPDGHPWKRGTQSSVVVPKEFEQMARATVNNPVRAAELEQAREQMRQRESALMEQLVRAQAQLEVMQSGQMRSPQDPATQQFLEDVKRAYPEQYEQIKASLEQGPQHLVEAKAHELRQRVEMVGAASSLAEAVRGHAPQRYAIWAQSGELPHRMQQLGDAFGQLVDAGMVRPSPEAFFDWVDRNAYIADPRVQAAVRQNAERAQAAERERIRQEESARLQAEAKRTEAARLKEAQDRHGNRPPSLPLGQARGLTTPSSAADESRMSPAQRQRAARDRAGQRAATLAG